METEKTEIAELREMHLDILRKFEAFTGTVDNLNFKLDRFERSKMQLCAFVSGAFFIFSMITSMITAWVMHLIQK